MKFYVHFFHVFPKGERKKSRLIKLQEKRRRRSDAFAHLILAKKLGREIVSVQ